MAWRGLCEHLLVTVLGSKSWVRLIYETIAFKGYEPQSCSPVVLSSSLLEQLNSVSIPHHGMREILCTIRENSITGQ